jgi:hypothetical protein
MRDSAASMANSFLMMEVIRAAPGVSRILLALRYVVGFAVSDDNEFVRYERLLVFHDSVLRNANTV